MSWWTTRDRPDDLTGDMPADAAADLLAPMRALDPKPSLDELLDALEAALVAASPRPYTGELGDRHLAASKVPRNPGPAKPELVALLAARIGEIAEPYRIDYQRLPRLEEYVYTIAFAMGPEYIRDPVESIGWIR